MGRGVIFRGHLRGHPIEWDGSEWVYSDTGEPTVSTWRDRPCGECGLHDTPEGHDGCLGTLALARNACCGHGRIRDAYVQLPGLTVRGKLARLAMGVLRREA